MFEDHGSLTFSEDLADKGDHILHLLRVEALNKQLLDIKLLCIYRAVVCDSKQPQEVAKQPKILLDGAGLATGTPIDNLIEHVFIDQHALSEDINDSLHGQ